MDFQADEETCSRVVVSDLDIRSQVTGLKSAQFLYPKDELFFTAATFMDMEVPALAQLKNIPLFSGPTGKSVQMADQWNQTGVEHTNGASLMFQGLKVQKKKKKESEPASRYLGRKMSSLPSHW